MVSGVDHKVAMFADDVLICLVEPEGSFKQLMTTLLDFGKLSGYKINISKTQVITLNYTVPMILCREYRVNWENMEIKYLGINITRDLSRLSQANYKPISFKIKADLHRWNLVPFLRFSSRLSAVKMNILPRLLFTFYLTFLEIYL